MTNRCISTAGEREVLAPSPGSDKRNVLPSLLLLQLLSPVGQPPRKPPSRVPAAWHPPRDKPAQQSWGDAPQAPLERQAGRRRTGV